MQRVQTPHLLISILFAAAILSACNNSNNAPSVADYMHDMDAAKAMLDTYHKNPTKFEKDPSAINASEAVADRMMKSSLWKCWPNKKITTANTDHDCLDKEGYKR